MKNQMKLKNNYNECITNLACSIQKYFGLEPKHNTIDYIDDLLNKKQPKNVLLLLFDGMGSRIIDKILNKDDFFIKNKLKELTTVFPATTTAATLSARTGLNPVEHGWLGWNMYVSPIKETITLFKDKVKVTGEISEEYLKIRDKKLPINTTADLINKKGKYFGVEISQFGGISFEDLDDMMKIIQEECSKEGKRYIYAYDNEPDHTMHDFGPYSNEAKEAVKQRNKKTEELCEKLDDTIIFIIADHGHRLAEHIYLKDYPEIKEMMERVTSIEQRAVSFKIKEGLKEEFKNKFNELFGQYFNLYPKEEIIESKLFGDGKQHEFFEEALGDFLAITDTNKCIIDTGDNVRVSSHAGYSDNEIHIPLIVVDKTNR